jgi:hypothetical protein
VSAAAHHNPELDEIFANGAMIVRLPAPKDRPAVMPKALPGTPRIHLYDRREQDAADAEASWLCERSGLLRRLRDGSTVAIDPSGKAIPVEPWRSQRFLALSRYNFSGDYQITAKMPNGTTFTARIVGWREEGPQSRLPAATVKAGQPADC